MPTDTSADYISIQGFRENKKTWEEFSHYVTEMIGETALRWEVLNHSGSGESLERWKKNIEELHRCISPFHSLLNMMLTFNLEAAHGNIRLSVGGGD